MNDLSSIAQLAATSDEQAARLLADSTHADLIARITATRYHASERSGSAEVPSATRPLTRRRLTIGLPAAAAVVAAALVISSSGQPGHHLGPTGVRPTKAELLSFTRHGRYIDVIVRNPLADAKKYNAEFKAHGLHITLSLVPASPSLVGTLVYFDGGSAIHPITAVGKCWTGGGGSKCPVGVRVPIGYRGTAALVFGRAARSGERYETTVSATMPGEVLHGLRIAGRRVARVLAMLRKRQVTVAEYNYQAPKRGGVLAHRVPLNWFVYDADPWAPGQVVLFVGKTRHERLYPPSTKQPSPKASRAPGL
ncbi:MAG TPA: hypothetical protein VN695_06575 [Streptosporangiaceae bacterium]|nr:hypothetical protein [Streptosporangiaceae bacterium]